ncbi:MAG: SUMF1/EgtB/PvdO family nonheme iron enzyme [Candidatus Marinimicrobia bacterium]|nr:SUMF1/EgtB/PvdO family nonheme iron enzyme [Candidatus Neomarinimicrobiota bacterium]
MKSAGIIVILIFIVSGCDKDDPIRYLEFISIPPGTFALGYADSSTIDYSYDILKYEVTNEFYFKFLRTSLNNEALTLNDEYVAGWYAGDSLFPAGEYPYLYYGDADGPISRDGNKFILDGEFKNHPVVYVTWYGAKAFAEYHAARLPTADEWEKAARGSNYFWFPWGNDLSGERANYFGSSDPYESNSIPTTPAGYYNDDHDTEDSPGFYGTYDQFGNVEEWTSSIYSFGAYNLRIVRGSSWATSLRPFPNIWQKGSYYPDKGNSTIGFRIVRD